MTQILRKLTPLNFVKVYNPGETGDSLKWGEIFRTRITPRVSSDEDNGYFIVQFKKMIVHIDSYKMKSREDYLFPKKWSLYVSNDNLTWKSISENDDPLCKEDNIYAVPNDYKDYCSKSEEFTYSTNHSGFHYFVKFVMRENSYHSSNNNRWQDCLAFRGFELIGSFIISCEQ
jgi:hypothetical protein